MQKATLESTIEKYHLNGLTENAKYVIKDKSVVISFSPKEHKALIGTIKCNGFDIEDSTIGIYATSQLIKLLKILDKEVNISLYKEQSVFTKLLLDDDKYNLEFFLADLHMIDKAHKLKSEPKNWEIEFPIGSEFVSRFNNAKKALGDIRSFTIEANQFEPNKATIILGVDSIVSNRIRFDIDINSEESVSTIPFEANIFSEVLSANRNGSGMFHLNKEGLIKMVFEEKITELSTVESTYFMVRLEN